MVLMHANNREEISEAYAGDIVALVGLKETRTGDTLCDPTKPVILEKMEFPDPVIEMKVEPKTKADQEKMAVALYKLAAEDPSFRVSTNSESGETIIKGMGELHLDIKVDILKRTHKVEVAGRRPAGRLSRSHHPQGDQGLHPQEADRRYGPVRPRHPRGRAQREGRGQCLRVQDRRRLGSEGIHPRRRKGPELGALQRPGHRLPGRRPEGDADRRRLSRGQLLGDRLRNRDPHGHARGLRAGGCRAARADHEGRSDHRPRNSSAA